MYSNQSSYNNHQKGETKMDDNFLTVNEANEEAEAKKPDYIGLSLEDKLVVQKSKPIFDLVNTDMTLLEFKLLDAYLGKIDSND